ncbi:type I polyketide synthase [Saccharothrix obliqua]|uniref:type I polyketide synthase n=1 Tax=Saccharothrix obliqua TaxID=2861747 RepID=UPI001C5F67EA|nr:SDR family NAD(P)-dependent oxidoreductase [Saccharothrix obliqua]MBW4717833.1 SDR family NAD(P)-dependent oxidoreductase [Saccharothrix obliqua]
MNLDVAIVGLSCRFPCADDPAGYWRLISEGGEGITRLDAEDLRAAGVDAARAADPDLVPAAGILAGADAFDAAFFGYPVADAARIDPQQRMFLQACWHALEDSGHRPGGRVGVYAGQTLGTHRVLDPVTFLGTSADLLAATDDKDFLPSRVCYKLGLTGPGVAVQSACSTSLVAVHLACQALLTYDCDTALAGGVSWTPLRRYGYLRQDGGVWSTDGHMRPFDAAASGFVPADGLGVVVLRRLADALADGDRVYAVIKGSAIDNDGHAKQSWVAPSADGQRRVILDALEAAGVHPDTIGYVEAHGTATPLGDAVEVAALTAAHRDAGGTGSARCALGSVKANIGHTDAAAGVAGLIKVALALHHGVKPPLVHFRTPNPEIDFAAFDPAAHGAWPGLRRAAVSAFGIGGTNAHLVLEQAPAREPGDPARPWTPIVLSARDPRALRDLAGRCATDLARGGTAAGDVALADVAHTLATGRTAFDHRVGGAFADAASASAGLAAFAAGGPGPTTGDAGRAPSRLAFLFPGGGASPTGAMRALRDTEPVFRAAVAECLEVAAPTAADRIRALLAGEADEGDPRHALPALFVAEVAFTRLLGALGVRPDVLLGHSLGEYAAAHVAGVFTLPDALAVVVERADILAGAARGAMLGVAAPPDTVRPLLGRGVSLAAVNGRDQCVLAGAAGRVREVAADLRRRGVDVRPLPLRTAAHSALIDPELPRFRRFLEGVPLRRPTLPLVSSLLGREVADEVTDPRYWVAHLRGTVRFADALDVLPDTAFVEAGPGTALTGLARAHVPGVVAVAAGKHTRDTRPDQAAVLDAAVALWTAGVDVDPHAWHAGQRRLKAPIAPYPFAATPLPSPKPVVTRPRGVLHGVTWRRTVDLAPPPPPERDWLIRSDGSALADRVAALVPPAVRGKPLRVIDFQAGAGGPLALAEWARLDVTVPVEVLVVTRDALAVTGDERLDPAQALAIGAAPVLAVEHPGTRVLVADVGTTAGRTADGVAELLAAEFDRAGATPVAYRGGYRWTRSFEPVTGGAGVLRDQGVYLITGGFGGAGVAVAEHLAKTRRARLALLGRRPADPDLVARLRGLGAQVAAHRGDVADAAEVRRLLDRVRDRFGRLDGVVHAAGVPGGGVLHALDTSTVADALHAKVNGARVLVDALRPDPPDFLLLFSSVAALRGAPGLACYAAANAFLDSFAVHASRELGVPALSLDWDRWRATGMAVDVERRHRDLTGAEAPGGLDPADAVAAFDAALGLVHLGQVVVTPDDPNTPPPAAPPRPPTRGDGGPQTATTVERALLRAWEATLGIDGIGLHDNFFDLGGDSLVAIRTARGCADALGAPVSPRTLLGAPTIARLARALEARDG